MNRKSISFKIFLVTLILLLVSASTIYLTLYFYLPIFYEKYKTNSLEVESNRLVEKAKNLYLDDATILFDKFEQNFNAYPSLTDNTGKIVFPNYPILSKAQMLDKKVDLDKEVEILAIEESTSQVGVALTAQVGVASTSQAGIITMNNLPKVHNISVPIVFKDETLTLNIHATLQPIDEASQVLLLLIPYIGIVIFIISISGAYIYSKIFSKPLITINHVAQKMANLDFTAKINLDSADEIGQLSRSLNEMSANLQRTMQELQTANEALKSDMEKKQEAEAKRRELFATISHELKSPITAVKGQLEGMLHNIGVYKEREKYLNRSYQIMETMESLVRQILQISKLEQLGFTSKYERVNISTLVCTTINNLGFFATEKNIQVINEVQEELFINTDKQLLEKVIGNVIHNAIVYSNHSEQVHIHLIDNGNGTLKFEVLNTGAYIQEEHIKQIFEPFYRVEKSRNRNTGGSGLGLYIVKTVCEALSIDYSMRNTNEGVLFSAQMNKNVQ
ncbi:sensor histidine kinase [Brevibacillus laterosporus]|uniref:histidine kinase n=1 Tax=Brevibacillus laterosporus TaxID=1465 RepID=A0A502HEC1_BRELA|nr:sensor histidine kinase [Brevibacillus laterosporus]TPG71550.1 sensor histidine kinase [Brevibacillus laterosporus]TPG86952.1 sensor histidine kinase [Brevibacillus laterosporus]